MKKRKRREVFQYKDSGDEWLSFSSCNTSLLTIGCEERGNSKY
jgi:hypothetical protein